MSRFQSRLDGEYRQCPNCERKGYGPDAWHPATAEFFPRIGRRVSFARYRACCSELTSKRRGIVPAAQAYAVEVAHA
jgi:hypothetical protein